MLGSWWFGIGKQDDKREKMMRTIARLLWTKSKGEDEEVVAVSA